MRYLFAGALLTLMGSQAAYAETVSQWAGNPLVNGDKTYTQISNDSQWNPVGVAVSGSPIYDLNLSGLTAITTSGSDLKFSILVTDPTMVLSAFRVSENDNLDNVTGGSVTTIYSDSGFSNQLDQLTLLQTQSSMSVMVAGYTTIYVDIKITGVGGDNLLNNLSVDVTQTTPSAVPEPSSLILLGLGGLATGIVARRRAAKRTT